MATNETKWTPGKTEFVSATTGESLTPGGAAGPCPVCRENGRAGGDPCVRPDGGTYRNHVHSGRPIRAALAKAEVK